jgi:DNA repair exonuclease SbcCD nuclease subunit
MRIVHISDLHLGRETESDPHGAFRLEGLRRAMEEIFPPLAPEALLVAGDLFDAPAIEPMLVKQAARLLGNAKGAGGKRIPVVLIPGNHDPGDAEALWQAFLSALDPASDVRLPLVPGVIELADGALAVECYPCETRFSGEPPWSSRKVRGFDKRRGGEVRVILAHGTLGGGPIPDGESEAYPFREQDLVSLGADYVALGHFHGLYPPWGAADTIQRSFSYCGSLEPDQFKGDPGWAILAELEPGRPARLTRVKTARRTWREIKVAVPEDLRRLEELVEEARSDPMRYVVRLSIGSNLTLDPRDLARLDDAKASLQFLGAHLDARGAVEAAAPAESSDLEELPGGAVKEALLALRSEMDESPDPGRRKALAEALQRGLRAFAKREKR